MSLLKIISAVIFIITITTYTTNASLYDNSRAIAVSGGEHHTLVLTADANLWACGPDYDAVFGGYGFLGIGTESAGVWKELLVQVHDGDANTPSGYLENIIAVDAGWKHSLAIDINNFVLAWGWNSEGQIGKPGQQRYTSPVLVHDGEMQTASGFLENIVAVSAGRSGEFSLALDANNHCWSWGMNNKGQLGNDSQTRRLTPVQVKGGEMGTTWLEDIACISTGMAHSAAVDSDGSVFCWGDNLFRLGGSGKLGTGSAVSNSDTPVQVKGEQPGGTYLKNIVAVSTGWDHTLALEEYEEYDPLKAQQDPNYTGPDPNHQGRVYSWGCNGRVYESDCDGGQLGDGTKTNRSTPVIVHAGQQNPTSPNSSLKGIIAVSAGENHSIALDVNGFVYAFGCNAFGQLGNGTTEMSKIPVQVLRGDNSEPLTNIVAISAAYWHNLSIDANGTVWSWGMPDDGRLGLGSAISAQLSTTARPINLVYNLTKQNYQFGIQTAIDDANNSNVLEAQPGTYYEQIDFGDKTVTLKSANPVDWDIVEKTTIYGPGSSDSYVVKLGQSQSSHISGFKITNADTAIECCDSATPLITNCLLTGNEDNGLYLYNDADVDVYDTKIISNAGAGVYCDGYPSHPAVTMTDCTVSNNGGDGLYGGDNVILRSVITDNGQAGIYGADNVAWSVITDNDGDGIYSDNPAAIANNIISRNKDHGIYSSAYSPSGSVDVTITNNWIYDNGTDGTGDGIYIEIAYPNPAVIRNNTIADNNDYGIRAGASTYADVTNCILWDNGLGQLNNCSATYSCIDIDPVSGAHNINSDPCFADDANNFHIKPESRCIDNANSALVTDPNELDIDGECRIMDGDFNGTDIVDMGADELYWPKCDYDRSEIVNFVDFTFFANAWQTTNTTIDLDDDNFVDINDLILFCSDWLWVAPWSARYEQMMMAGGDGEGMVMLAESTVPAVPLPALSYSSTATTEAEPLSTERIKELIDWTERLLETDDELKELVGEAEIQKILDSLKAELEN